LDQPHGLVDGDVGLALGVGVHRFDLIALDAALLDEVVDHDLGAERVELGAAARERAGVVIDDADLQLLALRRRVRRQRETQHHRQRDQPTRDAHRSIPEHERLPSERGSAAAGIRSWSSNNVRGRGGRRSRAPFSFEGFDAFNAGYRALLTDWKLLVDGENPIARTNVAPVVGAPTEPSLYGFGYTIPGGTPRPTFIVAGAGEMHERGVGVEGIVRHGETSAAAMRETAAHVMAIMQTRLHGLGVAWSDVTAIDIYTAQPIEPFLADTVL